MPSSLRLRVSPTTCWRKTRDLSKAQPCLGDRRPKTHSKAKRSVERRGRTAALRSGFQNELRRNPIMRTSENYFSRTSDNVHNRQLFLFYNASFRFMCNKNVRFRYCPEKSPKS